MMTSKERVEQLRVQLAKAEIELARQEELSSSIPAEVKEVAEKLHKKTCHQNHTDGCSWYYDNGSWTEYSRKKYLSKAEKLLSITTADVVFKILDCL